MKFTSGEWMMRKGVVAHNCEQIRQVKFSEDKKSVYLYGVSYKKDERALGGPIHEIYISSPLEDILRVECHHFRGSLAKQPAFELNDKRLELGYVRQEDKVVVTSGKLSLVITLLPCSFTYYYDGKRITSIGQRFKSAQLGYMQTEQGAFMRAQLQLDIDEKVYGLGERFTPFVKNGQVVDIWNEDGGTSTEIAYKNIPFYVTNKGYGVFVNDTGRVSYEICSENVTKAQFSVQGEKLDFMVVGGGSIKNVVANYTTLTGKPALVPAWSFGLWLTSSFTTSYDEDTVLSFIDGMSDRGIPLSVFHIDCFWMKENEWCGFEWDESVFPDVKSFLAKIKQKGIKVCVWINPYIGQKSAAFDEAKAGGYLLKKENGDIWQWDLWQAGLAVVDFTNPAALEWYKGKLRKLLEQGVDAFKTDFGERIPVDCVYYDGSDPQKMHNYYTQLYNKAVFEVLQEYKGKNEACLFARCATVGGQKFPVHWGGDCNSEFYSMYESLRGGLSLCMSGFGFWSHDIGGFEGNASDAVYKRWLAFGLLSTHSRLHGSTSYRVPWLFGEEAVQVCKKFTLLKNRLMPYIFSNAINTHNTGIPSMRPLVMEFDEIAAAECDRQFMLGDSLMVAPVFCDEGDVDFYLPKGEWTHLLSGEVVHSNGEWRHEKHDFFSLPLYVRQNTILPLGASEDRCVYDYTSNLTLNVYSLTDKANCDIFDSGGNLAFSVAAENKDGIVTLTFSKKPKNLSVLMVGIRTIKGLKGGASSACEKGVVISVTDTTVSFCL